MSIYKNSRRHPTDATTTTPQTVDKIPVIVYSTDDGDDESCVICLDDLVAGEEVRVLPRCHHTFHKGCIDRWLTAPSRVCPICRGPVLEEETKLEVSISVTDISVVISINV
ncbi:E3 ubiquitin-protein ligase RHA1B-like [Typha angustifolia]|uniref:E3 ubiquitin-protein ligase RHA1B-like n=1 Tax=Typha angustifolia TaxID=59011 RepID=UPI003C2AF7BC